MSRPRRRGALVVVVVVVAMSMLAPAAWAWAASLLAPRSAKVGATLSVVASGLIKGRYALTLVSDSHPARGVSCVARLSKSKLVIGGAVTLSGTVSPKLTCYQGLATSLGAVQTAAGAYHLVVAEPIAPAGFDSRGSFVRSALHLTR